MNESLAEHHVRIAIQDRTVAHWALRRLESKKTSADPNAVKLELSLFDDLTIRRLLDAGDIVLLSHMFRLLSSEQFQGTADLLAERWPGWEDTVAGWAAPVIAETLPDRGLELFEGYIASGSLWEDFNKTAGVSRALQLMHSKHACDLAQRMIQGMAGNTHGLEGAFAVTESIRLAWVHELPLLEELLTDLVTKQEQARLADRVLGETYRLFTDDRSFLEHIRDLQNGNTKQSFTSLAPLFDEGAPLEELDGLVTGVEKIDIDDAFVFLCERCRLRSYRPRDVARSIMMNREHSFQSVLKPVLGQFFLAIGIASWVRTSKNYTEFSAQECVRAIGADLRRLPDYEGFLGRLRECPADEVVRLITEKFPDVEEHYGAVHLARLMGDLGHDAFIPLLLTCLNEEQEDFLIEAATDALSLFGDRAECALVDSWEQLDENQRSAGLSVLARVGGEATVSLLVRCFPEMRNEWLETWRDTAEAVPDARLLEVLAPELERMNPLVDETFLLIATLLDIDHEQLATVRAREIARNVQRQSLASWTEGEVSASLRIELKCTVCGDLNEYEVNAIFVSPEAPEDKPFIADEITCRSCGAFDSMDLSSKGHLALMAEMLRAVTKEKEGGGIESPLKFVTAKLWDGRLTSVGGAINHYAEAIAKNPLSIVNMLSLANGYATVGRERQAEAYFRKSLRIEPSSPEAAYALAEILERGGKRAEAFRVLELALKHKGRWRFHRLAESAHEDFLEVFVELYESVAPNGKQLPQALRQAVEAPRKAETKIGPNAPCPCGSGKKYKKCCDRKG